MDWIVYPMMERGRLIPRLRLWAQPLRGRLRVDEQHDQHRGRTIRVATLLTGSAKGLAPALHDVQLVSATGDTLSLAGYEIMTAGPLQDIVMVAQAWLLKPAPDDALERAEAEVQRLLHMVADLQSRLDVGNPG